MVPQCCSDGLHTLGISYNPKSFSTAVFVFVWVLGRRGARLSSLLEGFIVFFSVFWFLAVVVMVKMFSSEHTTHALVNDRCVVRYSTHG